jgi:hypothetical protein
MAMSKEGAKEVLVTIFLFFITVLGTNAIASYSLDATFPKHPYVNQDYNPNATPQYEEVCDSSYGQGLTCGDKLLNASDYQLILTTRSFVSERVAVWFVGYNTFDDDGNGMLNFKFIYWAFYGGITWVCWKRIKKSMTPNNE